ncbi:MAG: hypothetical protein ACXVA9_07495 [Bdellovibrionales bacterium]
MKTILAMILALGFQAQAKAQSVGADEIKTIITCERAQNVPDLGLSVEVRQGGLAALTEVQVSKFFLGHSTIAKYYVQQLPIRSKHLGSPIVYQGNGVTLSINFTSSPDAKGGHQGFLEVTEASGDITTDELSCSAFAFASETTNQLIN